MHSALIALFALIGVVTVFTVLIFITSMSVCQLY